MGRRSVYALGLLALAALAAVLVMRSFHGESAAKVIQAQVAAEISPPIYAPNPASGANKIKDPVAAPLTDFPASVGADPQSRYKFAKNCAKFRQFDSFYKSQAASNPNWPLNNAKALAAADPELRNGIIATSRFLDQNREVCQPWLDSTPQDLANAQIYDASLRAALQGNKDAAACYILAAWQQPGSDSSYYADMLKNYTDNVGNFIHEGLMSGNWPIVLAAYKASLKENDLQAKVEISNKDSYLIARLAQQASPDGLAEEQFGYEAANRSRNLPASDVIDIDKQAAGLFASKFGRRKVSVQSVIDMCVN